MREDVFYLLAEMDRFYIDWQTKYLKNKIDSEAKAAKAKNKPAKGRRR